MNREEMLAAFGKLRFCVLWPGNWEDIGFTERPIWINSEGYGYYFDDEPCLFTLIENVAPETVSLIKQKAATGNLSVEDVLSTPFSELNTWDDEEYWEWHLGDFVNLPESSSGIVFCGDGDGGWFFFSTEEELITAFEKDSSDYNFGEKWADLDDALLEQWYMRIFSPGVDFELPMTLDITK